MPRPRLDNYLRTYRKRAGLSQGELAYLLGTDDAAKVSRYERGSRQPSLDAALAFQAIFNVSVEQLFAGRSIKAEGSVTRRARFLARRLSAEPKTARLSRKLESLAAIAAPAQSGVVVQ